MPMQPPILVAAWSSLMFEAFHRAAASVCALAGVVRARGLFEDPEAGTLELGACRMVPFAA